MKFIFSLLFLLTVFNCNSGEMITLILKEKNGKEYTLNVSINTKDLTIAPYKKDIISISNIEKLKKLKRLILDLNNGFETINFFKNLKLLEILQITGEMEDLSFLKYLKNLKILGINTGTLYKKEIDLINNQKLEYLEIQRVSIESQDLNLNLEIKNIPESLEYLNIQYTATHKIAIDFLESVEKIPIVLIDKELYLQYKDFFSQHLNFTFSKPEKILPIEFLDNNSLTKKSEYEFF